MKLNRQSHSSKDNALPFKSGNAAGAQSNGAVQKAGSKVILATPTVPEHLPADVAIRDLGLLLSAVKTRLIVAVNGSSESGSKLLVPEQADIEPEFQASVLECALALDQLQGTLEHELGRLQTLEREIFNMQTALAQAHVELAGTKAGERQARQMALHDSLTSLPNRSYFRERLDHALARAVTPCPANAVQQHTLTLLYLDLDGFKAINDQHGHGTGDELLCIVGLRLKRAIRAEDMVGRLGGDEFACLAADLSSREQMRHLARKLFDAVAAPVKIGKLRLVVRPSIGIAQCPQDGTTPEVLLQKADAAMYCAKRSQTGHAFFDEVADA